MTKSRLEEIRRELRKLDSLDEELDSLRRRGGNVRCRDLERVAEGLGFAAKKKRTGEPIWQGSDGDTVAIPCHSGTIGKGLSIRICKQLQKVIFKLRTKLEFEEEDINNTKSQLGNGKHYGY